MINKQFCLKIFTNTMSLEKDKIVGAYKKLLRCDEYLLLNDVNERSITHKLGEYLQEEFAEYNIDCEYNDNLGDPKNIEPWNSLKDNLINELANESLSERRKENIEKMLNGEVSVYPDIIIHHRGTKNNYIVIEAKKQKNNIGSDMEKLQSYKQSLGYQKAFFVTFITGVGTKEYTDRMINDLVEEI